jgi:N-acetylneuraminate lyase
MDMVILQGTTGEWPSLSTPERLAMAAAWRQAVPAGSRMKLILHVGHDSLVDAQRLAECAVSLDMDAVLISAPSKFTAHSPTDQARAVVDIMAHCASIPAFYCARPPLLLMSGRLLMSCGSLNVRVGVQITTPISTEIALTCTVSC